MVTTGAPPVRRMPRISAFLPLAAVVLAACDPAPASRPDTAPVTAAFFAEDPALLADAARAACNRPGETFHQPQKGVSQCRLLMDPETTAAVILNFDGAIDDLPQLVVSMVQSKAADGYLVTGCAFLKVPRKDGRISRVVQRDRAIDFRLREMLDSVGGRPVRDVPAEIAERCFSL